MTRMIPTPSPWNEIRAQAEHASAREPALSAILQHALLAHESFGTALAHRVAQGLASGTHQEAALAERFALLHREEPALAEAAWQDLQATVSRDPAFESMLEVFLFSKGFLALQAYRIAHRLHLDPASRIGRGIMFDHGSGIVIGETAVVGDNVSILQGVTLGGTGKECGDRHPKVRCGVMIGAGAKILGNIEIGEGAKVGAGSVVLADVAAHTTVVGNPARRVGTPRHEQPALDMDQSFDQDS